MKNEETIQKLEKWIEKSISNGNGDRVTSGTMGFMTPTHKIEEDVTQAKLQNWLEKDVYKYQRDKSLGWMKHWAKVIKKGEFRSLQIGIAICTHDNNRQVLVNGSHTATTCLKMGWTGKACVEYYKVSSDEELQILFASFDVINTRNVEDIVGGVANEMGIKSHARIIKKMVIAIQQVERVFTKKGIKVPRSFNPPVKQLFERAKLLEYWKPEIKDITNIFCETKNGKVELKNSNSNITHLVNRNIYSSMLMCLAIDKQKAKTFWNDVIFQENLEENPYAREFFFFFLKTLGERGGKMKVKVVATAIDSFCRYLYQHERVHKTISPRCKKGTNQLARPARDYINYEDKSKGLGLDD